MKALLITPEKQSIEEIDIDGYDDIVSIIGYDTVTADEIGDDGDRLYFDEECFLRGASGKFQVDTLIPVSGKALVVSSKDGGNTLQDVIVDLESLRQRTKFM